MSHLVVKQRSFWHSRVGISLGVVLLLLLVWGIFEFGRYRAGFDTLAASDAMTALQLQITELNQQQSTLREANAVLERSGQIERQAYKQLEGAVTGLQDEILELKEELAFYRGIVSPKDATKGLKIQDFELSKGIQPGQYHFKVVLTQVLNNGTVARGNLRFEVEGLQKGEQKLYTLEQMSDSKSKSGPAFHFKYFQILEGDFMLPEEFEPIKVNLTVKPKSRAHKKLTQAFDWVVGEKS
jgi:hypothetical protein